MAYGKEVIIDLKGCDVAKFTRAAIEEYMVGLCDRIDMVRCDLHFWDDLDTPETERQTEPHTKGTSAVQFILTSNITIHTLDLLGEVYVNIHSCKGFSESDAARYTRSFFAGEFQESMRGGQWMVVSRGTESRA